MPLCSPVGRCRRFKHAATVFGQKRPGWLFGGIRRGHARNIDAPEGLVIVVPLARWAARGGAFENQLSHAVPRSSYGSSRWKDRSCDFAPSGSRTGTLKMIRL